MVWEDLIPSKILTDAAVGNAVAVAMATGCSTNAIVHLVAMARRAGVNLTMDDLDRAGRTTPVLANIRPSGDSYLMEDFYYAGGLRALMANLASRLDLSVLTVSGQTLGETLEGRKCFNDDVIRSLDNPVYQEGSLAVVERQPCADGRCYKASRLRSETASAPGPGIGL